MALRFQDKGDDVDREVKDATPGLRGVFLFAILGGAFYFAVDAVSAFISGRDISTSRDFAIFGAVFLFALGVVDRFVGPKYQEFRIRTKEILGSVTKIEEDHRELLERLRAVEEELRSHRFEE